MDCGHSLEPPCRCGSNECRQSMFCSKIRKLGILERTFLREANKFFHRCDQPCSRGCAGREPICDQHFTCKYGCYRDYWGPSCNPCSDGCNPSPPPTAFTKCSKSDGSCLFGCSAGKYGLSCYESCPRHCKDDICNHTSGECVTCAKGFYGEFCNSTCSRNCPDNDCFPDNGTCIAANCLVAQYAWYGPSCERRCPRNCKDKVCDRETGHCLDGCITGFSGNLCDLGIHLCNNYFLEILHLLLFHINNDFFFFKML